MGSLQNRNQRSTLLFPATPDLRSLFLRTAAAGGLLLAVSALDPAVFSLATKAQAATAISTNINFYENLAGYGNWVSYQDRYVWIPDNVDEHWRPYTKGHWAYTRRYGWIWVSDESFGWATYHYGRWGYAHEIGWYWVPGSRWAPAWVAWSYDGDDIAWAPLPPHHYDGYDGANIVVSFGFIPDIYWQAVPASAFLSVDLSDHVYRDRGRVHRVIKRGVSRTVRILNKTVLNNAIKVDDIEKKTGKKVVVLEEKAVDNPDAVGKLDSNSVAIFNLEVKEEANGKPTKIKKFEEVVKEREAKAIPDKEQPSGQAATTDELVTKPKKDAAAAEIPQKAAASTDQPEIEKTAVAPADAQTVAVDSTRVAELKPDEPTKVTEVPPAPKPALPPSKTVTFDTVHYDQTGNIVFGGRGPADSKVRLYVDDNAYGLAFINDKGTWTFADLSPLAVGLHTLRAIEIGDDGTVKGRIEMPFYREEPAKVATAPLIPATPEAPKPAEVATAQEVPVLTPTVDTKKKDTVAPEQPTAPVDQQKKKIDAAMSEQPTASVDQKKKKLDAVAFEQPTASVDQKKKKIAAVVPEQPTAPVDQQKKKIDAAAPEQPTASVDQKKKKIVAVVPEQPTASVDQKKKKIDAAASKQQVAAKSVEAPVEEQTPPLMIKKKKKAEKPVNTAQKGSRKCDPAVADCPSARTLSKLKQKSTIRVIPKANLPDAGAENWRVECSARFGGWSKASETYVSSSGKRVSCAWRPKNARG